MRMIIIKISTTGEETMRAIIDAWVERPDPLVRLLGADTGTELLRWGPERVGVLLEEGTQWLPDLMDEGLSLLERLGGEC